jgi:hypothetical protein
MRASKPTEDCHLLTVIWIRTCLGLPNLSCNDLAQAFFTSQEQLMALRGGASLTNWQPIRFQGAVAVRVFYRLWDENWGLLLLMLANLRILQYAMCFFSLWNDFHLHFLPLSWTALGLYHPELAAGVHI